MLESLDIAQGRTTKDQGRRLSSVLRPWSFVTSIRIAIKKDATQNRADDYFNIQPDRPIFDVPQIILRPLDDGGIPAQTVDLRPTGHPSLLAMALHIARHELLKLLDKRGLLGTRP